MGSTWGGGVVTEEDGNRRRLEKLTIEFKENHHFLFSKYNIHC